MLNLKRRLLLLNRRLQMRRRLVNLDFLHRLTLSLLLFHRLLQQLSQIPINRHLSFLQLLRQVINIPELNLKLPTLLFHPLAFERYPYRHDLLYPTNLQININIKNQEIKTKKPTTHDDHELPSTTSKDDPWII